MASRAQIARLAQRIDDLVDHSKADQPRHVATIIQEVGETFEAAKRRHLEKHPEDRVATGWVCIALVDPPKRDEDAVST